MALSCGECGAVHGSRDSVTVEVVCHHCGKPLCNKHRMRIIDDAFYDGAEAALATPRSVMPAALLDALRLLRRMAQQILGFIGLASTSSIDSSRSAYHCETCKKRYHRWAI
jgi:hypothetical protein